ncbi:hypothetical protein GCM10009579_88690 [Streptomyces javensis]|uniref:Uncharacterized protein n=1 Tax=Streptomyces javensis TaxID=114698 RepID=A0ABN1XEF5_9ACTN
MIQPQRPTGAQPGPIRRRAERAATKDLSAADLEPPAPSVFDPLTGKVRVMIGKFAVPKTRLA